MIIKDSRCPKCGGLVEYNGNYYCAQITYDCNWVMSDSTRMTKKQKNEFVILYTLLMKQMGREPNREVIEEYL